MHVGAVQVTRKQVLRAVFFKTKILKCCDYCEVLCEILIFGFHVSLISYFLDGVHGLEHNNCF